MADFEFFDAAHHDVAVNWPTLLVALTPARFVDFKLVPTALTVDHLANFSGRGVYTDAQGVDQPAKKEFINFYLRTPARTLFLGQTHTDDLGNLSGTLHIDQSGTVLTQFAAGFLIGSAPETTVTVPVAQTRITAALDLQPTKTDQQVTISGKLERLAADGTWQPLSGRAVSCVPACSSNQYGGGSAAYTGRDGTFKAWTLTPAAGTWTLSFDPAGQAFNPAQTQVQVSDPSTLQDYTSFVDIAVDSVHVVPGAAVHVTARLVAGKTLPGTTPLQNARVSAYFMPDGGNTSTQTIDTTTDANGVLSFTGRVPQQGTWSLSFLGDAHHVQSQYAATPHIAVWGKSSFSLFKAAPLPVRKGHRLTITGYLDSFNGSATSTLEGAKVVIYFRARGTKPWIKITTVTAGRDGKFAAPVKALKSGSWEARYAGDANNLAVTSATTYARVTS